MNARDFFYKEDCENSEKYDLSSINEWEYSKKEMILFAEEYYKMKLNERQQDKEHEGNDDTRHNA